MPDTAIDAVLDQIEAGTNAPTTSVVDDASTGSSSTPIAIPPPLHGDVPPEAPTHLDDAAFLLRTALRRVEALRAAA
jgi:hypothetical protein